MLVSFHVSKQDNSPKEKSMPLAAPKARTPFDPFDPYPTPEKGAVSYQPLFSGVGYVSLFIPFGDNRKSVISVGEGV